MMLTTVVYWLLSRSEERRQGVHSIKHFPYGMSSPKTYPFSERFAREIYNVPYRPNVPFM